MAAQENNSPFPETGSLGSGAEFPVPSPSSVTFSDRKVFRLKLPTLRKVRFPGLPSRSINPSTFAEEPITQKEFANFLNRCIRSTDLPTPQQEEFFRFLVRRMEYDVDTADDEGRSPLLVAANSGKVAYVSFLLDWKYGLRADPTKKVCSVAGREKLKSVKELYTNEGCIRALLEDPRTVNYRSMSLGDGNVVTPGEGQHLFKSDTPLLTKAETLISFVMGFGFEVAHTTLERQFPPLSLFYGVVKALKKLQERHEALVVLKKQQWAYFKLMKNTVGLIRTLWKTLEEQRVHHTLSGETQEDIEDIKVQQDNVQRKFVENLVERVNYMSKEVENAGQITDGGSSIVRTSMIGLFDLRTDILKFLRETQDKIEVGNYLNHIKEEIARIITEQSVHGRGLREIYSKLIDSIDGSVAETKGDTEGVQQAVAKVWFNYEEEVSMDF